VISGLVFASKKTNRGVSLAFASYYGAACMNNTLGLCIFMALVYFRELSWTFSAEVRATASAPACGYGLLDVLPSRN